MGGLLNSSVGRATSIPRSVGILPDDEDDVEGVKAFVTGKKKEKKNERMMV